MKLFEQKEMHDQPLYYVQVESNYHVETDGKCMKDAVSFLMGQYAHSDGKHELDQCLNFSTEEARKFAEAIIALCDRIDKVSE